MAVIPAIIPAAPAPIIAIFKMLPINFFLIINRLFKNKDSKICMKTFKYKKYLPQDLGKIINSIKTKLKMSLY